MPTGAVDGGPTGAIQIHEAAKEGDKHTPTDQYEPNIDPVDDEEVPTEAGGLGLIIMSNLNRVRLSCCWVGWGQFLMKMKT